MRTFTEFCDRDPVAKQLVSELPDIQNSPERYRFQMKELGKHLARGILSQVKDVEAKNICVICTVEDADFLARGVIEQLELAGLEKQINMICLWNGKIRDEGVSLSPILREYKEELSGENPIFIVVKSIISGACVVKTNLSRAISFACPERIFVAAPVMLKGAEERLSSEFPSKIKDMFEFVHFATDTEKRGEDVIPGVGGSVYELLGLGNSVEKNRYVPKIVKERRAKVFSHAVA